MGNKIGKTVALLLVIVLLCSVYGTTACGSGNVGGTRSVITIGILADFTGAASAAVSSLVEGSEDYFRFANEQDLIPGGRIKVVTYDQKSDPGRVISGYTWLKGQGASAIYVVSASDKTLLVNRLADDKMLVVGPGIEEQDPGNEWVYALYGLQRDEAEVEMKWIMANWDYSGTGRSPKVAHLRWPIQSGIYYQNGIDAFLKAYPGKIEWAGEYVATMSQTTWAAEVGKTKDCDYILVSVVGAMSASFVKEARLRGYKGGFISGSTGFPGYWQIVMNTAASDQLCNCHYAMWTVGYTEDLPVVNEFLQVFDTYHPGERTRLLQGDTGPFMGWEIGMFTVDAINRAAATVGIKNVDPTAIKEALKTTNMSVEGTCAENVWYFTDGYHALVRQLKVFEWDQSSLSWKVISGWTEPL
ncbi:MAG: ABC transporter substrate-binding protein [Chloroflexi bacterium]|nr:ABC transporter substrate-binding protein [Chloroflexota bacterium]